MSKSGGLAHDLLEMPCLGRPFQLGTLYDCRNDSLIPGVTLWGPETLRTALHANMEGSDFEVITSDSLSKKMFLLDVSAGLKLSVLGGLVKAGGSGKFLYDRTTSKNQARVSLRYRATSRFEQLNMNHLGKFEYPRVFDDDIATHVVTGVLYGADAIFVFDRQVESSEKLKQVHGNLEAMISALPGIDLNVGGSADLDIQKKGKKEAEEIHCKFYGDFILPKNPTTYQDAVRVYQDLPKLLGGVGYPKSVAKKVWLYPLSKLDSKVHRLVREISSHLVDDVQGLLESLHELEIQTNDLIQHEVYNYFFKSKGDLEKLQSVIGSYRSKILRRLSTLLPQVRGGGADETKLAELIEENGISPFSYGHLSSWIKGKKIEASTLAVYLKELKNHQIQFAFSSAEMVDVTSKFDEEKILCFDFNIPAGNDIYLQRMEAYLRGQTLSQELHVQKAWYKTREMRQAFQRFVNFVKTNTDRKGVKYVVTNDTTESGGKLGVMFMYEDACPTMFEPPDQPSKPQALSVTHNSLQLKWAKPNYGATSVQSYTAAYRTSDDPIDQWCTQASDKECLELTNLTPGSLYYIKVTAETCVGSSPTSEVSEAVQLPPDQPGKPHAAIKNYNCVQLKWSKSKHGADIVQYYTVLYQSTDAQWCKNTSGEEFLLLTNLTPGSLYSFKVVAESSAGCSPSSEAIEVQLPPDQPGKPLATKVTHSSVQLKWDKPKHSSRIVEHYRFFHRLADNPPREWLVQEIDKEYLYLKKLTPGSLYYFKVTAESSVGSSPESAVDEVWLPPDQPGKPEIKSMTHNSLQLKWSKPKHGADIVQSYTLSYCCVGDLPYRCTQPCSEEYSMLTKLIPGSVYRFKVLANSRAGPSPASEVSEVMLPPDKPGTPHVSGVTHNSLQLTWAKPKRGAGIVQSYTVSYLSVDSPVNQWCTQASSEECLVLTNLTPGLLYHIKVTANSSAGSSPVSEMSEVRLPPGQPGKPCASRITHSSIQLDWLKPEHGAEIVKHYTLSYQSTEGQWCKKNIDKEFSVLANLTPGSLYSFQIVAESSAGYSPSSEVSQVRLPPDKPGKPVASDATYNSVCLKWTKPKHGAETVQLYTISCQAVDNQCHDIRTTSKHEYVTVTDLTPKTVYTFKVRAVSDAGHGPDSELSDPVETALPPPGKPYASYVAHNNLQLNWEKPSHGIDSVQFYTVSYCCTGNHSQDLWNTKRTPVAVESIQFDSLLPKTVYYFKVRAESALGPSPDSELSDSIETNLLPIGEPGKPIATKVTHNSVTLQWDKPKQSADVFKCYTIFYRRSSDDSGVDSSWYTHKTPNPLETAKLSDLVPQTAYVFKVRAELASPDSEISDPIETLSPISQPGKPRVSKLTHNSITLKWDKPERGAYIVEHYTILYRCSVADDAGAWNIHKTSNRKPETTVLNLDSKMSYIFKVRPEFASAFCTSRPESESSDPIETLSLISPPGKPHTVNVTPNSITLQWSKPDYGASIVQYYTIFYQRTADNRDKWTAFQTYNAQQQATLINLDLKTSYVFKLRAECATSSSPNSEVSDPIETLLPIISHNRPGKPIATDVAHNCITLRWRKPEHGFRNVQCYTIFYRDTRLCIDHHIKINASSSRAQEEVKLISDLAPNTEYTFKLRAESDTGVSPDSELSDSIRTLVPISEPGKPFATKVTHDSITLKWERPIQGAKNLKPYKVIYYSIDDLNYVSSRTAKAEKITLKKLDPESSYIFKVRAETGAGSTSESEVSDPIKTLLSPPGKPYATNITYQGFHVNWQKPTYGPILYYYVSYQATNDPPDKWHTKKIIGDITRFSFLAAKGNFYVFKVAAMTSAGASSDSELSDPIETL